MTASVMGGSSRVVPQLCRMARGRASVPPGGLAGGRGGAKAPRRGGRRWAPGQGKVGEARTKPGQGGGRAREGEPRARLSRRERPSRPVRRDRVRGCARGTEGAFWGQAE